MAKTLSRTAATARTSVQRPATARPKLNPEGIVVAIVAVTGVVDEVDDIIVPGAFAAALKKRRAKVVHHHDWLQDRGRILAAEELLPGDRRLPKLGPGGLPWPAEAGALLVTMQYNLEVQAGRDSWEMIRFYAESGEATFSIGYKVLPGLASKKGGIRYIYGLDLFEVSAVLHGAHPLTMALEVKNTPSDDLERKDTAWSSIATKAAQPDFTDGVMVALYPPAEVAEQLAVEGGLPAEELHVTLAYLGDGSDWTDEATAKIADALADAVSRSGVLTGQFGGLGQFPDSGTGVPTFVPVDVPGLVELRQTVVETLAAVGHPQRSEHGFTPHLTLGYDIDAPAPVAATPVTFEDAVLVVGETRQQLPLTPAQAEAPASQAPVRAPLEAKSALAVLTSAKPPAPARAGWASKSAGDVALVAQFGDPFGLLETKSGVPGVADTPQDQRSVARLRRAWVTGSVGKQIGWNTPGDFTRCTAIAGKYMSPEHAKGWCNLRHKDATGVYPGDRRNVGVESKSLNPTLETKTMPYMTGSIEDRLRSVREAVEALLTPPKPEGASTSCWVCLEATYDDHVIASVEDGSAARRSFQVPYTVAGDGVVLGEPVPVTLSIVAVADGGIDGEEVSTAAAVEARYLTPAIEHLGMVAGLVSSAEVEAKALRSMRPAVQDLLDSLAVKGMDVTGLLLGDDDEDADGDDSDGDDSAKSQKPWEKKGDPDEDEVETPEGDDFEDTDEGEPGDDTDYSDGEDDDEELETKDLITLDPSAVAAALASLSATSSTT